KDAAAKTLAAYGAVRTMPPGRDRSYSSGGCRHFQCAVGLVGFGDVECGVDVTGCSPVFAGGVVVAEFVEGTAEAGVGAGLLVAVLGGERQGERQGMVVTSLL